MFTNRLNMDLALQARVLRNGNTVSLVQKKLVKKTFQVQLSVKMILTVFWGIKGPFTIDFLEKVATVNNAPLLSTLLMKFTLFIE